MNNPKRLILAVIVLCIGNYSQNAEGGISLSNTEVAAKLVALKPLPKVHYSWKIEDGTLLEKTHDDLLYEYARITHALSLCGESVTFEQMDKCVYVCARINKTKPDIPCSIAVNFSPWHRKFKKDLPPTTEDPSYMEEIRYFKLRMNTIRQYLAQANKKYSVDVEISALLLDSERFQVKENDDIWNNAICVALDKIHLAGQEFFPKARIEWYGRGVSHVDKNPGWAKSSRWTGKEITPSLSCSLYRVPEIEGIREIYRRTCKLADEMKVSQVTPWVALAGGYRRTMDGSKYVDDWDYDVVYSYQVGAELNIGWYGRQSPEWFAPYNRAKVVIFYPAPFNRGTPHWGKHFIAYVRGATGVKDLTDLGYEQ